MKEYIQYIGIGAGICTAVSMLPQLIKIIRTKKAESMSLIMLAVLLLGLAGWIWYGWLKEDLPILLTNAFSVVVNVLIFIFSVKYKERQEAGVRRQEDKHPVVSS